MDPSLRLHHARNHAAPAAYRLERRDPFPAHGGPLRLFLRLGAFPGLRGCGSLAGLVDFPQGIVSWDTASRLLASIGADIYKRPYITVGFSALVLMLPLAVTSTAGWIRRLGGKRWSALHRLIYVTAILGVVHYWWLVKADIRHPATYGAIVAVLLGVRMYWTRQRPRAKSPSAPMITAES